ncbi:MAG: MAPEG family protein [Myxococcota bacterium]|nr:MAPEG family protein [Myxococcota bacterium]
MTVPFWCLFVAALLPYPLAFLGAYFKTQQLGSVDNKNPRAQSAQLAGAGARCVAAQQNAWEALPVFASGVFVAHLAGADPGRAALLSIVWVAARVLHAVFYLANLDVLRSLSFLVALACVIGLFVSSA